MKNGTEAFVAVAVYHRTEFAHIARLALEQEGIRVFLTQGFDAVFGTFMRTELWVRPSDVELAREILERPRKSHELQDEQ